MSIAPTAAQSRVSKGITSGIRRLAPLEEQNNPRSEIRPSLRLKADRLGASLSLPKRKKKRRENDLDIHHVSTTYPNLSCSSTKDAQRYQRAGRKYRAWSCVGWAGWEIERSADCSTATQIGHPAVRHYTQSHDPAMFWGRFKTAGELSVDAL